MRQLIFAGILLLSSATLSFAQDVSQPQPLPQSSQQSGPMMHHGGRMKSPDARAKQYTDILNSKLNLSTDQYAQIQSVNTRCIEMKDSIKMQGGSKADMRGIAIYRRQQYKTILNPDQLQKLKEMNQERKQNMQSGNMDTQDNNQ